MATVPERWLQTDNLHTGPGQCQIQVYGQQWLGCFRRHTLPAVREASAKIKLGSTNSMQAGCNLAVWLQWHAARTQLVVLLNGLTELASLRSGMDLASAVSKLLGRCLLLLGFSMKVVKQDWCSPKNRSSKQGAAGRTQSDLQIKSDRKNSSTSLIRVHSRW